MKLDLVPHPDAPPSIWTLRVWASAELSAAFGTTATLNIWFGVGAPIDRFVIPDPSDPIRIDELWKTTCFEAFLRRSDGTAYREWNFAPSSQWAAYDFTDYREGMSAADIAAEPYIRLEDNFTWWALGATIAVDAAAKWDLGLSAVIEESGGIKSYWAIAHPDGGKPDFHHPDCFAARLP